MRVIYTCRHVDLNFLTKTLLSAINYYWCKYVRPSCTNLSLTMWFQTQSFTTNSEILMTMTLVYLKILFFIHFGYLVIFLSTDFLLASNSLKWLLPLLLMWLFKNQGSAHILKNVFIFLQVSSHILFIQTVSPEWAELMYGYITMLRIFW